MRFSDVAVLNIFVLYFFYIRTVVKFDIYIIDKKIKSIHNNKKTLFNCLFVYCRFVPVMWLCKNVLYFLYLRKKISLTSK